MLGAICLEAYCQNAEVSAANQEIQRKILSVEKKYPDLKVDEMFAFYKEYGPDLLEEWQRRSQNSAEKADLYLDILSRHYLEIISLRNKDPEEYERLVKQQRTEYEIRLLSRQIQKLAASEKEPEKLAQSKKQLKKIMDDAFEEAQKRQFIEINRLENQIRELKNLANERAANKQTILQQRFYLLTGQKE